MLRLTHRPDVRAAATVDAYADTLVEIIFRGLTRTP